MTSISGARTNSRSLRLFSLADASTAGAIDSIETSVDFGFKESYRNRQSDGSKVTRPKSAAASCAKKQILLSSPFGKGGKRGICCQAMPVFQMVAFRL